MMDFASPWMLLLLVLVPLMAWWSWRQKGTAAVTFSSLRHIRNTPGSWRLKLRPLLGLLRWLCVAFLIIGLARPRKGTVLSEVSAEGIAIEAVVDRSSSMQAEMEYKSDKINRLEVVKRVLKDFIQGDGHDFTGRPGDMIGLITFAGYADTTCPLVLSHNALLEFLKQTNIVKIRSEDGTAIGDAIALGAARLKKAEEELKRRRMHMGLDKGLDSSSGDYTIHSKIIILLTDGVNNRGTDPLQAADLAKKWGIKVYTIGIGSRDSYRTVNTLMGPMRIPTADELDENLLTAVAERTGGFYARADDAESLRQIVEKINNLEKSKVKAVQYTEYSERFNWWTWPALGLLLLEILLSCTLFRKIP